MARPSTICGDCRYPLILSREATPYPPPPKCRNPLCPRRPACPECGSDGTHKGFIGGHMVCGCGASFDAKAEELEG